MGLAAMRRERFLSGWRARNSPSQIRWRCCRDARPAVTGVKAFAAIGRPEQLCMRLLVRHCAKRFKPGKNSRPVKTVSIAKLLSLLFQPDASECWDDRRVTVQA